MNKLTEFIKDVFKQIDAFFRPFCIYTYSTEGWDGYICECGHEVSGMEYVKMVCNTPVGKFPICEGCRKQIIESSNNLWIQYE